MCNSVIILNEKTFKENANLKKKKKRGKKADRFIPNTKTSNLRFPVLRYWRPVSRSTAVCFVYQWVKLKHSSLFKLWALSLFPFTSTSDFLKSFSKAWHLKSDKFMFTFLRTVSGWLMLDRNRCSKVYDIGISWHFHTEAFSRRIISVHFRWLSKQARHSTLRTLMWNIQFG